MQTYIVHMQAGSYLRAIRQKRKLISIFPNETLSYALAASKGVVLLSRKTKAFI